MKMNGMKTIAVAVIVIAAFSAAFGRAPKEAPKSGFLSEDSYKLLGPGKKADPLRERDWIYINSKADFSKYNKIMLDHVVFFLEDQAAYKGIESDEMTKMAEIFSQRDIPGII